MKIKKLKDAFVKFCKSTSMKVLLVFDGFLLLTIIGSSIIDKLYVEAQSEDVQETLLKYKDCLRFINVILPNRYVRILILVATIIFIGIAIYFRIFFEEKDIDKKDIHILAHSSMGKVQCIFSDQYIKENNPIIEPIDLSRDMVNTNGNIHKLGFVISMQDSLLEKFKDKISNSDRVGYMGIADTPLILRAGYMFNDEIKPVLYHKRRNEKYFKELTDISTYPKMKIESKTINDGAKELIVVIATTFPIDDAQLKLFTDRGMSIIKFKSEDMGFDVVEGTNQIDEYVLMILQEVRDIVRDNKMRRVHFVISSSVAFTFALGQRLSSRYDPETIVYQYDRQCPVYYPWGISVFMDSMDCVIINEEKRLGIY